ncbi:MAG: hypothetical protein AAFO96_18980 [Bacteroidota bacterium]
MKKYRGIFSYMILLSLGFSLISCQGGGSKAPSKLQKQWQDQLMLSATQFTTYTKTVEDLKEGADYVQDSVWTDMAIDEGDSSFVLMEDLSYALKAYYADPYTIELMDTTQVADTLQAVVKADMSNQTDLQRQKILFSKTGNFQYVSTSLHKQNWLYELDIDIAVSFDSVGRYTHHNMEILHRVPWTGKDIRARITGQAVYTR